jgi:hypothetical protein
MIAFVRAFLSLDVGGQALFNCVYVCMLYMSVCFCMNACMDFNAWFWPACMFGMYVVCILFISRCLPSDIARREQK